MSETPKMEDFPDLVRQTFLQLQQKVSVSEETFISMYMEILDLSLKGEMKKQFPNATEEQLTSLCHKFATGKLWRDIIIGYPGRILTDNRMAAVRTNRQKIIKYRGDWVETFYKSEEWNELRHLVLVRDDYKCRVCASEEDVAVHHIVPRVYIQDVTFDIDSLDNLIALCMECHPKADRKDEPSLKRSKW